MTPWVIFCFVIDNLSNKLYNLTTNCRWAKLDNRANSSAGRAMPLQGRGQEFESPLVHKV